MNPIVLASQPRATFQNPYFKLQTLLLDLEIPQNLHKLASNPLPPLTDDEKGSLLKSYKTRFPVKADRKPYRTTLFDLYQTLLKETDLKSVYHCGSGGIKSIAETYFPRVIQDAYYRIHRRDLYLTEELLQCIRDVCHHYCFRTDDDLQNVFHEPIKEQALKAHNVYLDFFAGVCFTSPYLVQTNSFKKIHIPTDDDRNQFWLHSFGKYDIVDEVKIEQNRIFRKGAGRIMVLPLFQENLDCELRVEAPLQNPWEMIFDILSGRLTHAEEEAPAEATPFYEWRHTLKMWTEMVKGFVPTKSSLIPILIEQVMNDDLDIIDQIKNYWCDHLPCSISSGAAYILQIVSQLIHHSKTDDSLLEKIITETKTIWKSSPYSEFLQYTDRDSLKTNLAIITILAWLQESDTWENDSESWVQIKTCDKTCSYLTLPLDFENALLQIMDRPEVFRQHRHLFPLLPPYSLLAGVVPEEKWTEQLLGHEDKDIRRLGLSIYCQRLRYLKKPEAPSPYFYERLPVLDLTPDDSRSIVTYHPEAEFSEDLSPFSLAQGLLRTREHRYYHVVGQIINGADSLTYVELYSLFQLARGTGLESFILQRAAANAHEWKLNEYTDQQTFLVFVSKVIGQLVRQDKRPQAARVYCILILPSSLKTPIKLKILKQLLQEGVPIDKESVLSLQQFLENDSECTQYLQAISGLYADDEQIDIFKNLMLEFKNAPQPGVAKFMLEFCSQLTESKQIDFWLYGLNTQVWSVLPKNQGNYSLLIAQMFLRCYHDFTTDESVDDTLKALADAIESTALDREIGTLQSSYIQSHYEELTLDRLPCYHTCCLTRKHKHRILLLRIKKTMELGHLEQSLRLALRLKEIPPGLIATLETKICENPRVHGSKAHSRELKKLYEKAGRGIAPLCAQLLATVSVEEAPLLAREHLTEVMKESPELVSTELFPVVLQILSASDRSDYPEEVIHQLKNLIPDLVGSCNLSDFATLNRFQFLNHAANFELETILTLCQKQVKSSPLLVQGIMTTLVNYSCGSLGGEIAFELARYHQSMNLEQSLFWFKISEKFHTFDQSTRTAYLYELLLHVPSLSKREQIQIYMKLLPLIELIPDLIKTLIHSFIESDPKSYHKLAIPLFHALYMTDSQCLKLDKHFCQLFKILVKSKQTVSPTEQEMITNILEHFALQQRSIFALLSQSPSSMTSLTELGEVYGDFLSLQKTDVTYLIRCLEEGTDEQKTLLIQQFIAFPPFLLEPAGYENLLRYAYQIDSYQPEFLSIIIERTQVYYDFLKTSKNRSHLHILPLYIQLCMKEGSEAALRIACQRIETCLTAFPFIATMTPAPFRKEEMIQLHNFLLSLVVNRSEPRINLGLLTRSMNPNDFSNETLLYVLKLLQKFRPNKSLDIQLNCWEVIVSRHKVSRQNDVSHDLRCQFTHACNECMKDNKLREQVLSLSQYRWVVHYLYDDRTVQHFFKAVILSENCRIMKHLPSLFSEYYKTSKPRIRRDLTTATQFALQTMHSKDSKKDKLIKNYIYEMMEGTVSKQCLVLHELMLPSVPCFLLNRNQEIDLYEKFNLALFHPKNPYLPYAMLHIEPIIESFSRLPSIVRYTENPVFQRILIFFADQMHEKLSGEGINLKNEYAFLIHLLIMVICCWNKDLIDSVDFERFIDIFSRDSSSDHSKKLTDILLFLKAIFVDYNFDVGIGKKKHEIDAIYAFAGYPSSTGFALSVLLLAILHKQSKNISAAEFKDYCKTLQILLASNHEDTSGTPDHYSSEIIKFHQAFQRNISFPELLQIYSDLIKDQEKKSPFMEAIYGGLLATSRPSDLEFSCFLDHLLHFSSCETIEGNEDHYPKIVEILSFYLRDEISVSQDDIDRLVAIMGHFINSGQITITPQFQLVRPIIDMLYTRENLSDFEEDIAPYTAQVYSWAPLKKRAPNLDIQEAKKSLILMCTSLDHVGMQVLLPALLAEFKEYAAARAYEELLNQVSLDLEQTHKIEAFTDKNNALITYPDTLIAYHLQDSSPYDLPKLPLVIDAICDLLNLPSTHFWILSVLGIYWETYLVNLTSDKIPELFSLFESLLSTIVKHDLFINTEVTFQDEKFTPMYKIVDYLLMDRWLEDKDASYFEALFASLRKAVVIVSKANQSTARNNFQKCLKIQLVKNIPHPYKSKNFKELICILDP